ncbi:MAG: HisA/HisF-related TIM barrel protein [Candidatus Woesearchaeota archaeon]
MIYPCIDLQDGEVVQLVQGKEKGIEIAKTYQEMAELFAENNLTINVIDLNAAKGNGNNYDIIKDLVKIVDARVGGGVRTADKAKELIDLGAKKVIAGNSCFDKFFFLNYSFLKKTSQAIGRKKLISALDIKQGNIAINGWQNTLNADLSFVVPELEEFCSELQCTYVDKEGMLQGTDMNLFKKLREMSSLELTAAGGITRMSDIYQLEYLGLNSVIGMAFYTGKISIDEVVNANQLDFVKGRGTIPAIIQNVDGDVLYLCTQNRGTLQKSLDTGKLWRYSVSQEREIQVGESSGKFEYVSEIFRNCYDDTLLIKVTQEKPFACHEGYKTCFFDKMINGKFQTVQQRLIDPKKVYGGK